MKSNGLILIIALNLFFSCNTGDAIDENTCDVENPIADLAWLNSKIADLEASEATTSKYQYVSRLNTIIRRYLYSETAAMYVIRL